MNLIEFVGRPPVPEPWREGDNIPWNDPAFSERMLKEHLSQDHDAASRRFEKIDRQVAWIHQQVLSGRPARILDLGCGPGLYDLRLAKLGHDCTGIDFSPASVRYAREQAGQAGLHCNFVHEDVRLAAFGSGYDMAMFIFGEFNVFKPDDARLILGKVHAALVPGGVLLLEPNKFTSIEAMGHEPNTWSAQRSGLFADEPYVYFEEHAWDATTRTMTTRHYVLDAATAQLSRYAATYQAYSDDDLSALLQQNGFENICIYPSLIGVDDPTQSGFIAVTATKAI